MFHHAARSKKFVDKEEGKKEKNQTITSFQTSV